MRHILHAPEENGSGNPQTGRPTGEALEALRTWMLAIARRQCCSYDLDAEDVVQQALLQVLVRDNLEPIKNQQAYLMVTIRNIARNQQRKTYRDRGMMTQLCLTAAEADDTCQDILNAALLHSRINMLSETERHIIRRRIGGATEEVIGDELGVSASTVCRVFRSAVAQLQFYPENVRVRLCGRPRGHNLVFVDEMPIDLSVEHFRFFAYMCSRAWHEPARFFSLQEIQVPSLRHGGMKLLVSISAIFDEAMPGLWERLIERRTRSDLRLRIVRKNIEVGPGLDAGLMQLFE
jgi:RNA polymerase sigma factor (sigma-70 family)